jgi:hypothetical protein
MILTLVLAADARDNSRAVSRLPVGDYTAAWFGDVPGGNVRQWFEDCDRPETVRIMKTDRWQYNENMIDELRQLAALCTVIDPAGLLGVQTSTVHTPEMIAKRTITDPTPIGANLAGAHQKQQSARKRQPTRYGNRPRSDS